MYKLTNRINGGYISNLKKVKVPFKMKYRPILKKLCDLNFIDNFNITNNSIDILLRYYNNKPLIFLETLSLESYKQYHKFKKIKLELNNKGDITIYSNNLGILIDTEIHLLKLGGKSLLKVHLLYKNILY
jgi:ribosomal protein S8